MYARVLSLEGIGLVRDLKGDGSLGQGWAFSVIRMLVDIPTQCFRRVGKREDSEEAVSGACGCLGRGLNALQDFHTPAVGDGRWELERGVQTLQPTLPSGAGAGAGTVERWLSGAGMGQEFPGFHSKGNLGERS